VWSGSAEGREENRNSEFRFFVGTLGVAFVENRADPN
jgi:hypothetical protein